MGRGRGRPAGTTQQPELDEVPEGMKRFEIRAVDGVDFLVDDASEKLHSVIAAPAGFFAVVEHLC